MNLWSRDSQIKIIRPNLATASLNAMNVLNQSMLTSSSCSDLHDLLIIGQMTMKWNLEWHHKIPCHRIQQAGVLELMASINVMVPGTVRSIVASLRFKGFNQDLHWWPPNCYFEKNCKVYCYVRANTPVVSWGGTPRCHWKMCFSCRYRPKNSKWNGPGTMCSSAATWDLDCSSWQTKSYYWQTKCY
jgi:hypothetical protein